MRNIFSFLFIFTVFLSTIDSAYCCVNDVLAHAAEIKQLTTDSNYNSSGSAQTTEAQHHCEMTCPCVHNYVGSVTPLTKVILPQNNGHFLSYFFSYEAPYIGVEPFPPIQA